MTPQQLKNSILQLAIQGKLVEQRPEEGTARELLQEISAEKGRLIREGKIKKAKPLPEISEAEIPFEVPESWEWVRLGAVSSYSQAKKKISPSEIRPDMWSLDMEDIEKESGKVLRIEKAKNREIIGDKLIFNKGDILYSKLRPYLKKILIAPDDGICSSELVPFFCYGRLNAQYVMWYLRSPYVTQIVNSVSYGVKMPRVGKDTIIMLSVPIPPLAEQHRIVSKIEELLPYIDQYDKAYTKLNEWNEKFPESIKKSILQYAMEGKLVEQRPEEGTAEELLREIRAEKERLVKEGKIRKTKPLPEISEDEIPFEVPESWMWVRLGDILSSLTDGTHKTPKYTVSGIPFISVKNISSRSLSFENTKFISAREHEELIKRCHPEKGDILLSKVGTTGIPVIIASEQEFSIFVSIALLKFSSHMYAPYLLRAIESPNVQEQCKTHTRGVGNKNWVLNDIANTILPLPPLAEQKRIVTRIEELLSHCNAL